MPLNQTLKFIPPYFSNFQHTACWQCSLRSVLEYFEPHKTWTWQELDDFTGREENGTWPMKTGAESEKLGYEVAFIEDFDYEKFIKDPKGYFTETFSAEMAEYAFESSNMQLEAERSQALIEAKNVEIIVRNSTADDIKNYLNQGYLIINWINPNVLKNEPGVWGHFILIYDYDEKGAYCHDSGGTKLEGQIPSRYIDFEMLMKASTDNGKTGGFYAFRKQEAN